MRWVALAACAVLAAAVAAPAGADAPMYRGTMTLGTAEPVHVASQGALWTARFVEHRPGRMAYSACVVHRTLEGTVSCQAGKTNARGVGTLNFAAFVNRYPGSWVVRFFELGRQLDAWRFRVRPESS